MPIKTQDFKCLQCDHAWEHYFWPEDFDEIKDSRGNITHTIKKDAVPLCPKCRSPKTVILPGGMPTKCHDPVVRSEMLRKRSEDHTLRSARSNVERINETGR